MLLLTGMGRIGVFLLFLAALAMADEEDVRCQSCRAVASELQFRLKEEAQEARKRIDLRNRLDEQGQRYGKVLDFRLSEVRIFELLDGLCKEVGKWELGKAGSREIWYPPKQHYRQKGITKVDAPTQELKQQQRALENYCGQLLEKNEDEIAEALKKDSPVDFSKRGAFRLLCHRITPVCKNEPYTGGGSNEL